MNRLNFSLPEFTRIAWTSEQAREAWEYRIAAINVAWQELERSSVTAGIRQGALQAIEPEMLTAFQHWCFDNELGMAIVGRDGISTNYGNAALPVITGHPWAYRVYFGRNPIEFVKAWNRDELEVGKLLGYPICCSVFFKEYWTEAGWRDLTYPMVGCQPGKIVGPFTCNILLRHIGVRAVFHLPCSFDCIATDALGNSILAHGRAMGFNDEMNWITEILNWPIRWSSLHGVTVITTPILKIISSSDALAETAVLDREGKGYPVEGAVGIEFPFQTTRTLTIQGQTDVWTDNGFTNPFAMKHAHGVILNTIIELGIEPGIILDLGCGNGLLLEKIKAKHPDILTVGVEIDESKCERAALRGNSIFWGDIVRTEAYLNQPYTLILIALNRLLEINSDLFLSKIQDSTLFLAIYSYQGWDNSVNNIIENYFETLNITKSGGTEVRILRPR